MDEKKVNELLNLFNKNVKKILVNPSLNKIMAPILNIGKINVLIIGKDEKIKNKLCDPNSIGELLNCLEFKKEKIGTINGKPLFLYFNSHSKNKQNKFIHSNFNLDFRGRVVLSLEDTNLYEDDIKNFQKLEIREKDNLDLLLQEIVIPEFEEL